MTFVFNYKGKKYTEEEIAQRITMGISTESDTNTRLLIMNLSNTNLCVLKSLLPDIQEICDCLFLKKYMAAITLTNLLFETMVKNWSWFTLKQMVELWMMDMILTTCMRRN